MAVRKKNGRMTILRKELLRIKDVEGNKPIQRVERTTYKRVYLVQQKHNRELVAQIGTGLENFLQTIFPPESILVLRELDSTGYFDESGMHSEFATKFENELSCISGGEIFTSTPSCPPQNRFARRAIKVEGTPFQPTTNPSGNPTNNNKTYKQAADTAVISDHAPRFPEAALQEEREREMETMRQQAKEEAIRAVEIKISENIEKDRETNVNIRKK